MRKEVKYGDVIKLSNAYTLSWTDLETFFPNLKDIASSTGNMANEKQMSGRMTQIHNTPLPDVQSIFHQHDTPKMKENDSKTEQAKRGWNWGAFLLGWIWGVGHHCWWPLLTGIGLGIITVLLTIISPGAGTIASGITNLLSFAISIYLGVNGNAIGWDNGCYTDIDHFHSKEKKWTIAGLIIWGISIFVAVILFVFAFSLFASLNY